MIDPPVTLSVLTVRARNVLRSLDTASTAADLYWNYSRLVAILSAAIAGSETSRVLARAGAQLSLVLTEGLGAVQAALPRGFAPTKDAVLGVARKVAAALESSYVN